MSRKLTPLAHSAVDLAQTGQIMVATQVTTSITGHAQSTGGGGAQDFIELLAGAECGEFTAKNNTTGTLFFPEISFFSAFFNMSRNIFGMGGYLQAPIQGKTKNSHSDHLSRDGTYDPDVPVISNNYLFMQVGDRIIGRFVRAAISKPHLGPNDRVRIMVTKGV